MLQIGSNTKAFTSVVLLQLEAEGRLSIHDKLGAWLPQYPAWRDVTIAQLLSMTSGIPDYAGQDAFGEVFVAGPPLGPATYAYSNTNYILTQMIIERATHDSYAAQLSRRILRPLGMRDTCLPPACPPGTATRMPPGYFGFSDLPGWLGKPAPPLALSWAQGADGLVGSLWDFTTWATALYGGRLMPPAQQRELRSLVSMTTGRRQLRGCHGTHHSTPDVLVTERLATGHTAKRGDAMSCRSWHVTRKGCRRRATGDARRSLRRALRNIQQVPDDKATVPS